MQYNFWYSIDTALYFFSAFEVEIQNISWKKILSIPAFKVVRQSIFFSTSRVKSWMESSPLDPSMNAIQPEILCAAGVPSQLLDHWAFGLLFSLGWNTFMEIMVDEDILSPGDICNGMELF